mmetsp:Transcript_18272/g.46137  ORF Transcript_18272/g.46137 Transcript_18272/m.46137 type:complete len:200 (+) Transcript_18272:947-1546(+)
MVCSTHARASDRAPTSLAGGKPATAATTRSASASATLMQARRGAIAAHRRSMVRCASHAVGSCAAFSFSSSSFSSRLSEWYLSSRRFRYFSPLSISVRAAVTAGVPSFISIFCHCSPLAASSRSSRSSAIATRSWPNRLSGQAKLLTSCAFFSTAPSSSSLPSSASASVISASMSSKFVSVAVATRVPIALSASLYIAA